MHPDFSLVFIRFQLADVHAHQLTHGIAGHVGISLVDLFQDAVRIDHPVAIHRGVDHLLVSLLGNLQLLAFGDIPAGGKQVGLVIDHHPIDANLDINHAAVLAPVHRIEHVASADERADPCTQFLCRVMNVPVTHIELQNLFPRVTQHAAEGIVGLEHIAVDIQHMDAFH